MSSEWSRSLNAACRFALFAGMVVCNATDVPGQAIQPAPPKPLPKAVPEPARPHVEQRSEGGPRPTARASEWDEEEEQEVERAAAGKALGARAMMQLPISVENSVYGVNDDGGNLRLKKLLGHKLISIVLEYPELSQLEIQQLELAGRGDIKRFQDAVSALHAKHRETSWNGPGHQEMFADLQKFQYRINGDHFFDNQSLLTKTLRSIVSKNKLTAEVTPGADEALNLPDDPPFLDGGFAFMQVQRADGKLAMMLVYRPNLRPALPGVRLIPAVPRPAPAPAVPPPPPKRPARRLDDK